MTDKEIVELKGICQELTSRARYQIMIFSYYKATRYMKMENLIENGYVPLSQAEKMLDKTEKALF